MSIEKEYIPLVNNDSTEHNTHSVINNDSTEHNTHSIINNDNIRSVDGNLL
ncbi:hypothetical protein NEPAR08_1118 [Nematocida parisii]|nr:hypothetical protein NEPAR03_0502 [Nematocida parisii]KAI5128254.1 hypothetical protein NEPAR08_1118 [Nematocida parisii]